MTRLGFKCYWQGQEVCFLLLHAQGHTHTHTHAHIHIGYLHEPSTFNFLASADHCKVESVYVRIVSTFMQILMWRGKVCVLHALICICAVSLWITTCDTNFNVCPLLNLC